jgi:hypothetical protein
LDNETDAARLHAITHTTTRAADDARVPDNRGFAFGRQISRRRPRVRRFLPAAES